jgi:heat shock protein HslJ
MAPVEGASLTGTTWVIDFIAGQDALTGSPPEITFGADGRATGTGGCNRFRAGYLAEGRGLRLEPAVATRMGCAEAAMTQEAAFFEALSAVDGFGFSPDGRLFLLGLTGRTLMTARPAG